MDDYGSGYIGLTALAGYLAVSIRTVHRLVGSGVIPSVKVGRRRLVSRDAVKDWLSGNEVQQVAS